MTIKSLLLSISLTACSFGSEGDDLACANGKCDGEPVCTDPGYGDGVCQTHLACDAPDIDCFVTFTDDAAAAVWYAPFEERLAMEAGHPPRAIVAQSDPHFVRARALLDRGWEAFRAARPVGDLRYRRPALVVIDDPTANAFVVPDLASDRSALAVIVQTGLLDTGAADEQLLGVMMHEFQHAVGLHVTGDVKNELRTFYVAEPGIEPIGTEQTGDDRVAAAGSAWRALAGEVGPFSTADLRGLPLGGELAQILRRVLDDGAAANPDGCARSLGLLDQLRSDLVAALDPESGALVIGSAIPSRVTTTMAALRDECLPAYTPSFVDVVATIAGSTPAAIDAQLTPEDRAMVSGVHVIDALAALANDRRAQQRAIEAQFAADFGRPWSALRFFSFEEDADDTSVAVLRAAELAPDGLAEFFLAALASPSCATILDAGDLPPYGVDLTDEHHATCWRVDHVRRYAAHTMPAKRASRRPTAAARTLLPPRATDRIAY